MSAAFTIIILKPIPVTTRTRCSPATTPTQTSIHVTILHRHALNDTDGIESSPDAPLLVTEHIFVISPDCKHDHHSVHQCRGLMADHLKSIKKYNATVIHQFTDSCSAQYKSFHCMGDVCQFLRKGLHLFL